MAFWLVFLGGGLGSVSRYGISILSSKFYLGKFPLGTFISNILACILLAWIIYILKDKVSGQPWVFPLLITGFCGGFSTFSTWSNETFVLIENGNYGIAIANILLSILVGIGLIFWIKLSA